MLASLIPTGTLPAHSLVNTAVNFASNKQCCKRYSYSKAVLLVALPALAINSVLATPAAIGRTVTHLADLSIPKACLALAEGIGHTFRNLIAVAVVAVFLFLSIFAPRILLHIKQEDLPQTDKEKISELEGQIQDNKATILERNNRIQELEKELMSKTSKLQEINQALEHVMKLNLEAGQLLQKRAIEGEKLQKLNQLFQQQQKSSSTLTEKQQKEIYSLSRASLALREVLKDVSHALKSEHLEGLRMIDSFLSSYEVDDESSSSANSSSNSPVSSSSSTSSSLSSHIPSSTST